MNRLLHLAVPFFFLVVSPSPAAEEPVNFREKVDKSNELIKSYRHFEAADALKEATKLAGDRHPSLHMRLAILYYGIGLIPEAIAEGERAVALAPSAKWYKYDLGKFYFVDKQYSKAEQQFVALLTLDPGFTLGYFYLAELYCLNKNYDMAWLSLQRACLLGYQGKQLEKKLGPHTKKPQEDFSTLSPETMIFRFIKVGSESDAKKILAEILKGKLFEHLELESKKEGTGDNEFGMIDIREVAASLAESLTSYQLYAQPALVKMGEEYRIMQKIAPFDPAKWQAIAASPGKRTKEPTPLTIVKMTTDSTTNEKTKSYPQATPTQSSPAASPEASPIQQQLSSQLEAYYALESWKNAWQAADVDSYLAAYSAEFLPANNISLADWKNKRRTSITRPKYIRLKVENPVVDIQPGNRLQITFTQHYSSDTLSDSVRKVLIMIKENGKWKIKEEQTLEILGQ
jgi:tetratricopeptide (TPR) repeat protein